ncbi:hypothetical protein DFAR_1150004 [Desulfarculales bacterium]
MGYIAVGGIGQSVYCRADLFLEGRRLASQLVERSMAEYRETVGELYQTNRETMPLLREVSARSAYPCTKSSPPWPRLS